MYASRSLLNGPKDNVEAAVVLKIKGKLKASGARLVN